MTDGLRGPAFLSAFHHRNFRLLWTGAFLSSLGTWTQDVALAWLIHTRLHDPFYLGLRAFASDAPLLAFMLVGGAVADRVDRRRILLTSQVLQMTYAVVLGVLYATGRLGIDLLAAKGPIEVVPGIQKFVINCNWKFAVDNLFDWYHPQVTHASAFTPGVFPGAPSVEVVGNPSVIDTGDVQMEGGGDLDIPVTTITGTTFDQVVVIGEYGHGIGGPTASSKASSSNFDYEWRKTPEAREALGPVGVQVAGHPNIFPTLWVTTTNQVSLRIPRDPQHTEIWWFTFAPVDAPPEVRQLLIGFANHVFGPAGLLEQDDGENWAQATMQTVGIASRRVPHVLKMGAGRGKVIKEHGLARIETTTNEHGQLWTYHAWAQWMKGLDWDSLRTSTTPPDIL